MVSFYQEQISCSSNGFTLAKADILRKAMSSKQADLLHSLRADFILGSQKDWVYKTVGWKDLWFNWKVCELWFQ